MYKFSKIMMTSLLVAGLLMAVKLHVAAQTQPVYLLNQQEVNFKSGVSLAALQQEEAVELSLPLGISPVTYDSLVLYLARGNRPLIKEQVPLHSRKSVEISNIMKSAKAGDRLVLELLHKDKSQSQLSVIFLH